MSKKQSERQSPLEQLQQQLEDLVKAGKFELQSREWVDGRMHGYREGQAEGRREMVALLLQLSIRKEFGDVPGRLSMKIREASLDDLVAWLYRRALGMPLEDPLPGCEDLA